MDLIQWYFSSQLFAVVILDLKIRPKDLAESFRLITLNIPQELGLDNHKGQKRLVY